MNTAPNTPDDQISDADAELDRDAMLFCLEPSRFVVVRREGSRRIQPIEGDWEELCRLQPGDRVIYEGTPTVVKAVEVY